MTAFVPPLPDLPPGKLIRIMNYSEAVLWVRGRGLGAAQGVPVFPGRSVTLPIPTAESGPYQIKPPRKDRAAIRINKRSHGCSR